MKIRRSCFGQAGFTPANFYSATFHTKEQGFTLIEILVVMGLIAVLAAMVLIAINPARQFRQSRDTQRWSDMNALLNAVGQSMADGKGLPCAALPVATAAIKSGGAANTVDLKCLAPKYISKMPVDPKTGTWTDDNTYDAAYTIVQDSTYGRITVTATPEEAASISITR